MNWKEIRTPIKVNRLRELFRLSKYDKGKALFLIDGFTNGFDLGYRGPENRIDESDNIPLRVGSPTELWNKVMKEVQEKRFAGPFEKVPFNTYIQSPIGLVPKAGNKTRLIFHLSYDFNGDNLDSKSVNYHTPDQLCTVKYNDLDAAVGQCISILKEIDGILWNQNGKGKHILVFGKSDLSNAFRLAPMKVGHRRWLVLKAQHPITKIWQYFVDKCMPLGQASAVPSSRNSRMD